jgi:hypothetical protein
MCEGDGDGDDGVEFWCAYVRLLVHLQTGMVVGGLGFLRLLIVRYK